MKATFKRLLTFSIPLILASCGLDTSDLGSDIFGPEVPSCSTSFEQDYDDVMRTAAILKNETDVTAAKSAANQFRLRYAGTKCRGQQLLDSWTNRYISKTVDVDRDMPIFIAQVSDSWEKKHSASAWAGDYPRVGE